jgi:hypothetical protein
VLSEFTTAWRFAKLPINNAPFFVYATTDGVVRNPSIFGITTGLLPSITAITELVVPKSIPKIFSRLITNNFIKIF